MLSRFVDKISKEDQEKADKTLAQATFASGTHFQLLKIKIGWITTILKSSNMQITITLSFIPSALEHKKW